MAIGVHGNQMTGMQFPAQVDTEPNDATATTHPLPMGVGVAVVVARGQLIVMSVAMVTEDVITTV